MLLSVALFRQRTWYITIKSTLYYDRSALYTKSSKMFFLGSCQHPSSLTGPPCKTHTLEISKYINVAFKTIVAKLSYDVLLLRLRIDSMIQLSCALCVCVNDYVV